MVGVAGFEPATSWSQTTRPTKLSHTPMLVAGARIELALEAYEASEATTPPSCHNVCMVSPAGFEPASMDSKSIILSVELRGHGGEDGI